MCRKPSKMMFDTMNVDLVYAAIGKPRTGKNNQSALET